jgi:hypothetical protein
MIKALPANCGFPLPVIPIDIEDNKTNSKISSSFCLTVAIFTQPLARTPLSIRRREKMKIRL